MLRKSALFACAGLLILTGCQKSSASTTSNAKVSTKVLKEGTSKRTVENGDAVWAVYTGRLTNGTVVDSNSDANSKFPYFFVVGEKMVIKGWDLGVIGMKVGEKRQLTIPPELAYGDSEQANIPPGSTLIFDLEVVGLSKLKEVNTYYMEDLKPGNGAVAEKGKTASVHYMVKYMNGRVLDDSRKRGATVDFKIGIVSPTMQNNKSVVGLEDGVIGMKVGGKRHLILPPNLIFGPTGTSSVSANQMIDVVVDLVSVK